MSPHNIIYIHLSELGLYKALKSVGGVRGDSDDGLCNNIDEIGADKSLSFFFSESLFSLKP